MEKSLGAEIKSLAASRGLTTQAAIATATGLSQSFISRLLADQRPELTAAVLYRVCAALGVGADHFAAYLAPGVTVPPPATPVPSPLVLTAPPSQPVGSLYERTIELRGTIAAGPMNMPEAYDPPESHVLSHRPPPRCFALRVTGHSCSQWGICDGDVIVVQETATALEGRFVVVQNEYGYTLKGYRNRQLWQFRPEDDEPVEFEAERPQVVAILVDGSYNGTRFFRPRRY